MAALAMRLIPNRLSGPLAQLSEPLEKFLTVHKQPQLSYIYVRLASAKFPHHPNPRPSRM